MKRTGKQAGETSTAVSEKVELQGLFAMMLGVWYPRFRQQRGPPRRRRPCSPDSRSDHRAAYTAAARRRPITDEGLMSQQYFDEAEAGASLIAVLAPEPRLVTEARQILASPGARRMIRGPPDEAQSKGCVFRRAVV